MLLEELFAGLFEARKNPTINKRFTAFEQLHQWLGNYIDANPNTNINDLYISFTNVNKIGLNPLYSYEITPAGIYTFNLTQLYEEYNIGKHKSFNRVLPSTVVGRKFIQIVKYNHSGGKFLDFSKYTEADLRLDIEKIRKLIPNDRLTLDDPEYFDEYVLEVFSEVQPSQFDYKPSAGRKFLNLCKSLTYKRPKKIIKKSEPSKKDIPYFQNFETIDVSIASINWNWLLRKLGYEVLDDPAASAHANEYIQTVFLTSKSFDRLATLTNTDDLPMDELELEILSGNVARILKLMAGKYHPNLIKKYPKILDIHIRPSESRKLFGMLQAFGLKLDMYHDFDEMVTKYPSDYTPYFEKSDVEFLSYSDTVANKYLEALHKSYNNDQLVKINIDRIIKKNPKWLPYFKNSQYK
jgi:hypothetical protein